MNRLAGLLLLLACVKAPPPVIEAPPAAAVTLVAPAPDPVRATIDRFVEATRGGRFDEVLALLAKPLRDRYQTADRLERDLRAEPLASARLEQVSRATGAPAVTGDSATLEWAPGRKLRLVREAEGWRITSLE